MTSANFFAPSAFIHVKVVVVLLKEHPLSDHLPMLILHVISRSYVRSDSTYKWRIVQLVKSIHTKDADTVLK